MSVLFYAAMVHYAVKGNFGAFFQFGEILGHVRDGSGYFVAWMWSLVIGFGVGAVMSVLSATGIGAILYPAAIYLMTMITGHLFGQWAAKSYGYPGLGSGAPAYAARLLPAGTLRRLRPPTRLRHLRRSPLPPLLLAATRLPRRLRRTRLRYLPQHRRTSLPRPRPQQLPSRPRTCRRRLLRPSLPNRPRMSRLPRPQLPRRTQRSVRPRILSPRPSRRHSSHSEPRRDSPGGALLLSTTMIEKEGGPCGDEVAPSSPQGPNR